MTLCYDARECNATLGRCVNHVTSADARVQACAISYRCVWSKNVSIYTVLDADAFLATYNYEYMQICCVFFLSIAIS